MKWTHRTQLVAKSRFKKLGDTHHFGQYVQRVSTPKDGFIISKPRSLKAEFLFTGNTSPLSFLSQAFGYDFIGSYQDDFEIWMGQTNDLSEFFVNRIGKSQMLRISESAGRLLAMCTLFGISDLHHENIAAIRYENRSFYYPLDLEIIFKTMITGAETCLFPSLLVARDKCGFKSNLTKFFLDPSRMLSGFLSATSEITYLLPDLVEFIFKELREHPVRVLLRPTKAYVSAIESLNFIDHDVPFLKSEINQMKQGDIPYYFYFLNSAPQLRFFSSVNTTETCDPLHLSKRVQKYFFNYDSFINPERIERLIKVTILHLLNNQFAMKDDETILGDDFVVTATHSKISFISSKYRIEANRVTK